MNSRLPLPGELWTVPEAGPHALVLVLSEPTENSAGMLDFQGIGARPSTGDRSHAFVDEVVIADTELEGDAAIAVELWNLRPLLVENLGERVARITSPVAFDTVWDAFVRMADPRVAVDLNRFGLAVPSPEVIGKRHDLLGAWHALSMRTCVRTNRLKFDLQGAGIFSAEEQEQLITYLFFDATHAVPVSKGKQNRISAAVPVVSPRLLGALMPSAKTRGAKPGAKVKAVAVPQVLSPIPSQVVDLDVARESIYTKAYQATAPTQIARFNLAVCR